MRKLISKQELFEKGWTNMDVGKYIVSFCETCGLQRIHHCTGIKRDNGSTVLRFECDTCYEKLNGNNGGKKYANAVV